MHGALARSRVIVTLPSVIVQHVLHRARGRHGGGGRRVDRPGGLPGGRVLADVLAGRRRILGRQARSTCSPAAPQCEPDGVGGTVPQPATSTVARTANITRRRGEASPVNCVTADPAAGRTRWPGVSHPSLGCDRGSADSHLYAHRGRRADPAGGHVRDQQDRSSGRGVRGRRRGKLDDRRGPGHPRPARRGRGGAAHHPERAVRRRGRPVQAAGRDRSRSSRSPA